MEEIEVKFLDVDVLDFKSRLQRLNAEFVGKYHYRRKTYDFADKSLGAEHAWVRLRDEGERVTLTYKQRFGVSENNLQTGGMKEIEVVVSDFDLTDQLLTAIGLIEKFYEENERERYILNNVEIDIDTWPLIPSYVELEGGSWESIEREARALGFDWSSHLRCSTMQVYEKYGINENDYSVLTFHEQIKK